MEEVDEDPGDLGSVLGSAANSPCDLKQVTSSLCASFPFCKVWRAQSSLRSCLPGSGARDYIILFYSRAAHRVGAVQERTDGQGEVEVVGRLLRSLLPRGCAFISQHIEEIFSF